MHARVLLALVSFAPHVLMSDKTGQYGYLFDQGRGSTRKELRQGSDVFEQAPLILAAE
jgi:hypothetical protein